MARFVQDNNGRGSLKWIQRAVNRHPEILTRAVLSHFGPDAGSNITWLSPRAEDEYAEYRDQAFVDLLGLKDLGVPLADFWPGRGPQWDALGKTDTGGLVLVEAKANIPEAVTPGTEAGERSKRLIEQSLGATKAYLGVNPDIPWLGTPALGRG